MGSPILKMAMYANENTSPTNDNFAPYAGGGRHNGRSSAPDGCEGPSLKGDVFFSGDTRLAKEQWYVSYVFTTLKTGTGSTGMASNVSSA